MDKIKSSNRCGNESPRNKVHQQWCKRHVRELLRFTALRRLCRGLGALTAVRRAAPVSAPGTNGVVWLCQVQMVVLQPATRAASSAAEAGAPARGTSPTEPRLDPAYLPIVISQSNSKVSLCSTLQSAAFLS